MTTAMAAAAPETESFRLDFERAQASRSAGEPPWLAALRRAGLAHFQEQGFPTTKNERWKYTSLAPLVRTRFVPTGPERAAGVREDDLAGLALDDAGEGNRLVLVDGRFAPHLSSLRTQDGLEIVSLREGLDRCPQVLEAQLGHQARLESPFTALNTAFVEDGAYVSVPKGTILREPIHIVHFATGGGMVCHPRTLVLLGSSSQATVVESFGSRDNETYWTNAVTEVVLEDGAILDHYKVQQESEAAYHVSLLAVRQGRTSRFSDHSILLGAALGRHEIDQTFAGEGGECFLNGLFMVSGNQHTDTHTMIDHAQPHCASRELYKGILDGRARGVFHGTIRVRKDAQKTDAWQVNKNLLLSRDALVNSTPALEILADDVKCKHGSTTGQIDPLALFYLRSRGIEEAAARSLLTYAFASDLVSRIQVPRLRAGLERYLQSHLPSGREIREAVA